MANAGAIPPMICRGGEILKLRVEGVPLGLLDSREYEEVDFPGALRRRAGALFRRRHRPPRRRWPRIRPHPPGRVDKARHCDRPPREIVAAIFAELDRFSTVLFDDQTLLVMKVKS